MVLTGAAGIQAKRGLGYHIRVKTYKLLKKLGMLPLPWEAVIIRVLQQS